MLLRGGAGGRAAVGPTYGASQAGAILRLPLERGAEWQSFVFLRSSSALSKPWRELTLGLGARPFRGVPVILAGEVRLEQNGDSIRARPGVGLVTAIPPVGLSGGVVASAHAQAGWVAGTWSSAYADGQLRLDRQRAFAGGAKLHAGLAVWGAGQRGASRLDAGPSVGVTLPIASRTTLWLQADWRHRVAGNAAPGSGPALVLAASF